jgi:SAM-dependent methyltransferase
VYTHRVPQWIRGAMPDVHARLSVSGSRVADVACGAGWAAIAIARAYPHTSMDGFENDPDLVEDAIGHAREAGVSDRVSFHLHDCNRPAPVARFDLVCLFDTLHELPRPVDVLRTCGAFCGPAGSVLVMDARVADRFEAPADEIERFQYTTSVLHCLPACLADPPSAGTGTVMRAPQVRRFAEEAGFSRVEILPIDERFHRFYRLLL